MAKWVTRAGVDGGGGRAGSEPRCDWRSYTTTTTTAAAATTLRTYLYSAGTMSGPDSNSSRSMSISWTDGHASSTAERILSRVEGRARGPGGK